MLLLGLDNPEFFFQPFRHEAPMATHLERSPTQNDGIGAKVFSNLLCVERIKRLAVLPVKQFWVFRFQKPTGRSQRHVALSPIELGHPQANGHRLRIPNWHCAFGPYSQRLRDNG